MERNDFGIMSRNCVCDWTDKMSLVCCCGVLEVHGVKQIRSKQEERCSTNTTQLFESQTRSSSMSGSAAAPSCGTR